MNTGWRCSRCGAELSEATAGGYCPGCLLQEGVDTEASVAGSLEQEGGVHPFQVGIALPGINGQRFGDYELLGKVGQGGMGVVYRARQINLDRIVAVKLLPFGQFSREDVVQRFQAEATAAAGLQHPNIVAIHDVGAFEGQHYFSMDFIEGQTLADVVRDNPLPARRAAAYLKTIAEAVHYAHQHGILHRDLKPSNILIDRSDQPRITDFGLAKRLTVESDMTLTGQVLGSPNFMAPEQAEGRLQAVGPATEVYSLGALLYHLLTRQPPFLADTLTTLLKQVIETDPVPPRLLNPSIPRDLETICLKCLEKEAHRRYQTAQALAEDLARFLADEPVLARPVGATGKCWRWCRRRPLVAGLAAGLVLISGLASTEVLLQRNRARRDEVRVRQNAYAADIKLAQLAHANNDLGLTLSYLDRCRPDGNSGSDLRNWEWRYLWQLCQGGQSFVLASRAARVDAVALSPDGTVLAVQTRGEKARLWDVAAKRIIAELPWTGTVQPLAFSHMGRLLAVGHLGGGGQQVLSVCDMNAHELSTPFPYPSPPRSATFSPNDKLLATFDDSGNVRVVEWERNRLVKTFKAPAPVRGEIGKLAFSPDGNLLAVGEDYGVLRILDLRTGSELRMSAHLLDGISALAFSPDGALLAGALAYSSGTIGLWDARSGERLGELTNAMAWVRALAFTPDGSQLAAASVGGTVRIWNVALRAEALRLRGHAGEGQALAFLSDGQTLVSACTERMACGWDLKGRAWPFPHDCLRISAAFNPTNFNPTNMNWTEGKMPAPPRPEAVSRLGGAFTSDSQRFITTQPDGCIGIWDLQSRQWTDRFRALGTNVWGVALSPNAHWLAVADAAGKVRVWTWPRNQLVANLDLRFAWCGLLEFSAGGRFLLGLSTSRDENHLLKMWRTKDWLEVPFPEGRTNGLYSVAVSPDQRFLAMGYRNGALRVWDIRSGREPMVSTKHHGRLGTLLFSPDGRRLVTTSLGDGLIIIWNCASWREEATLHGDTWSAAFSSDSRRLFTGHFNKEAVKIWDLATSRELLTLDGEGEYFVSLAVSPDGNGLVSTTVNGLANFWRAPSWKEIAESDENTSFRP